MPLLFLLMLLAQMPASVAVRLIPSQWLPPHTLLLEPEGTVWKGRLGRVESLGVLVENLSWDVDLLAAFTGKPRLVVKGGRSGSSLYGQATLLANGWRQTVQVVEAQGKVPIPLLARLQGLPSNTPLDGEVAFDIGNMAATLQGLLPLTATMNITNLRIGKGTERPLGLITVQLTPQETATRITIKDNGGSLKVDLSGDLNPDTSYSVAGAVKAVDPAVQPTVNLLKLFGKAEADGGVRLEMRGRLL